MKNKKRLYLIIALLLPLLYHLLNKAWYYLMFKINLVDMMPNIIRKYLLTNAMSFDAIFCFLMILIVLPIFIKIRKEDKEIIPKEYITTLDVKGFLKIITVTFGIAGLTMICQIFTRFFLKNLDFVSKGIETFDKTFSTATSAHAYFWVFLSVVLLGPIIEELIFRGILFSQVNRYVSGKWAVIISALYFGLWHSNPIQIIYTVILGFFVALIYAATRNMWFPILIHIFNNFLSSLPPALENNEDFMLFMLLIRGIFIIPMLVIVYKMVKNNKAVSFKMNK